MIWGKEQDERRSTERLPIERELRYKVFHRNSPDEGGAGKTIDMSSSGVLFTTDRPVRSGKSVEVSISWPAQLNHTVPLKLVARGRVVRSDDGKTAIEIQHKEFRTQASPRPDVAAHSDKS